MNPYIFQCRLNQFIRFGSIAVLICPIIFIAVSEKHKNELRCHSTHHVLPPIPFHSMLLIHPEEQSLNGKTIFLWNSSFVSSSFQQFFFLRKTWPHRKFPGTLMHNFHTFLIHIKIKMKNILYQFIFSLIVNMMNFIWRDQKHISTLERIQFLPNSIQYTSMSDIYKDMLYILPSPCQLY